MLNHPLHLVNLGIYFWQYLIAFCVAVTTSLSLDSKGVYLAHETGG
jgi:hypothetical protein